MYEETRLKHFPTLDSGNSESEAISFPIPPVTLKGAFEINKCNADGSFAFERNEEEVQFRDIHEHLSNMQREGGRNFLPTFSTIEVADSDTPCFALITA